MSDWRTIYPRDPRGREVRISPSGIVVVEDVLADGSFRHTRVTPNV
jgi:hypothetical protein